jgi:hypothetical protein
MQTIGHLLAFAKMVFEKYEEPTDYLDEFERKIKVDVLNLDIATTSLITCNSIDITDSLQRLKDSKLIREDLTLSDKDKEALLIVFLNQMNKTFDLLVDEVVLKTLKDK